MCQSMDVYRVIVFCRLRGSAVLFEAEIVEELAKEDSPEQERSVNHVHRSRA